MTTIPPKHEDFFKQVHHIARQIPLGRVCTYGHIGAALGAKSSARMVGWAMNAAHTAVPPVPAHRVVNRLGMLTGKHHFVYNTLMEELLAAEGVEVIDDKVADFKEKLWIPNI